MEDPHAPDGGEALEGRIITEGHLRHFVNDNTRRHGVIDAVAGAGKSHQLEEALSMLPEEARVLLVAFNDKNAKDMKDIIARRRRLNTCQASTFHKWAFRLLRGVNSAEKVKVEEYKFKRFQGDRVLSGPGRWQRAKAAEDLANIAQNTNCVLGEAELESLRQQYALGLQLSPVDQRRVVRAVSAELQHLKTNIKDLPVAAVDFNDMIWLPAISDDILLEINFDWIFLDECQDFSPVQLLLLRRVLEANPRVRVLAAGDPHQSIYGFRGVQDSMPELRSILNEHGEGVDEFTLPVCRRCPASHLRLARLVVPHIQPLPVREEGVLRHSLAATWQMTQGEMTPGDYVLCRQVKPLVQLACDMVKEQRPARIVGEKSIKSGLLAFFSDQGNATVDQVKQSMEDSRKVVKAELLANGDTKQLGIYEQFYETALLLLEELESPQAVIEFLKATFVSEAEPDLINCSTIHKIKGATQGNVWLLVGAPAGREHHPPLALLEGEERRILYVALTRSERELIIAECPFVKVDWPEVEKLIHGEASSPAARAPIVSAATLPREMFDLLHPQAPPAPSQH